MKPYDLKVLVEKLKPHGLNLAEEGALKFIEEFFGWLEESATLSENKIDDMLKVLYPIVKKEVIEAAKEISPN